MYGLVLPRGVEGQVDGGLGKSGSTGTVTLIPPTDLIQTTGEKMTVDGIEMEFQMAPGTEAPAYDDEEAVDDPVTPDPDEEPEPDIAPSEDDPTVTDVPVIV